MSSGFRRAALVVVVLHVGACGPEQTGGPIAPEGPLVELPRALSADEQRVVEAANDFAFALLARSAADMDGKPNLVLSPLSASFALGMLLNGATGETRTEMEQALRLQGLDAHAINAGYEDLIALLTGLDDEVTLDIANAIWARQGVAFERAFLDTSVTYFDAVVRTLDFDDPASVDVINGWVRDQTNRRIDGIVDQIDPAAVMYLMNAIYFRGDWTRSFDAERTRRAPFTRADGSTVEVQMMDMDEAPHLFAQTEDGTTLVDLSYSRGAYSMTLVLPPQTTDAMSFAVELDRTHWHQLIARLDTSRVMVRMPKFILEYDRVLNDDLRALGMQRAFTDAAEFDALTSEPVYVHQVRQKSFIAVDEVGTEAAAVTSVEVRVVSMPPHIFLDRPFVFAIRERLSGTVLFVGVVGDPS